MLLPARTFNVCHGALATALSELDADRRCVGHVELCPKRFPIATLYGRARKKTDVDNLRNTQKYMEKIPGDVLPTLAHHGT